MTIDCTLDSLMIPALATYPNEFGTKVAKGGLSTEMCCDNIALPFRKQRPYEVNETSETTEIQHNAIFVVKTAGIILTLHDGSEDFLGCEARVINTSTGNITVKGGVSGLDGAATGVVVPSKREMRFIYLSDGWHSSYNEYQNVINEEIADGTIGLSKIQKDALLNYFYPVGSLYSSSKTTNPSLLFGGTWKQITDCFILAAGEIGKDGAKKADVTGGSATHKLTVDEMPIHSHSLSKDNAILTMNEHFHAIKAHTHTISPHTHNAGTMKIVGEAKMMIHESQGYSGALSTTHNGSSDGNANSVRGTQGLLKLFADSTHGWSGYTSTNLDKNGASSTDDGKGLVTKSNTSALSTDSYKSTGFISGKTDDKGGDTNFSIMPPYITKYVWERTA